MKNLIHLHPFSISIIFTPCSMNVPVYSNNTVQDSYHQPQYDFSLLPTLNRTHNIRIASLKVTIIVTGSVISSGRNDHPTNANYLKWNINIGFILCKEE